MNKSTSNREKKHAVREGVRALKNKPGWNPDNFVPQSAQEKLMLLDQQSRDDSVFQSSETCSKCSTLRTQTKDESALCDTHLAEAMGF